MKPLRPPSHLPRTHLLHPDRPYTPADRTDIRATFAKAREKMAQAKRKEA